MSKEKTITVEGYFGKPVEKTKKAFVDLWIDNACLSRLVICDGADEFPKTMDWSESITDEIRKLAEYNWEYLYKKENEKEVV